MGPRSTWVAALAAVAVAATASGLAEASGPAAPLGHDGRWLTDAHGRVVVLHGLNMVFKRPPYAPSAAGFGEDDARFLAAEGYNTIRLGVIYKAVEPRPGRYDDRYLADIKRTVDILGRHGIFSLVDFHQDLYNERFQGEGWPDWAIVGDAATLPPQPQAGFPGNYTAMPALQRAFDHFWSNDPGPGDVGLQDRYAAAWRHVARRMRDDRHVLGYDLLNEPWPGTTWQTCANPEGCPVFDALMTRFIKRTIAAIRQADRRTLVWYEPNVIFNDGADTQVGDTGDPRAGFSFHDYCLPQGFAQADPARSCDAFDDMVFAHALHHADAVGDTLLLSEFGATDDLDTLERMVQRADRNMVSWQEWHYCGCDDPTTSGPGDTQALVLDPAKPPRGHNLKKAKLAVLSRPYPEAIAGTPESFGFDPGSRTFRLRYATKPVRGADLRSSLTQVAIPRRQYPRGYTVRARGAKVVSPPGARRLKLVTCRGADQVRVKVTPGPRRAQDGC